MPRASKAEHEQRIEQFVQLMILKDAQRRDLIPWAKARWGIGERQADKYIAAARERMVQGLAVDRAFESAQSLRRHAVVFVQALKDGKLAVAEKALHDIDLLRGLGVRGAQAQELDTATLRRNFAEIAAELLEAGELDEVG